MTYTLAQLEGFVSSGAYDAGTAQAIADGVPELAGYKAEGSRNAPVAAAPAAPAQRAVAALGRQLADNAPAKTGSKPEPKQTAAPAARPPRRRRSATPPKGGAPSGGGKGAAKPKPAAAAKLVTTPELADTARRLSAGEDLSADDVQALVRNGLARQLKNGTVILSETGLRATRQKAYTMIDIYDVNTWIAQTATKAQTPEDRAMFAKMGGGGSGGGKGGGAGGGSKLWPKGPNGKRTPQAAAAETRGSGGGKSDAKPAGVALPAAPAKGETIKLDAGAEKMPVMMRTTSDGTTHYAIGNRVTTNRANAEKWIKENDRNAGKERQRREAQETHARAESEKRHAAEQERRDAKQRDTDRHAVQRQIDDLRRKIDNGDDSATTRRALDRAQQKRSDLLNRSKSFQVFKDARGDWRWVAFSSTAYRDRDGEIVSTKALADDCQFADQMQSYGPLRWWHVPGLDLGDCDFNAMHGRVLIESGTFRSQAIARKIARAAGDLEISLGFLHPPNEPDAAGVFHSILRFERSLTPRGKASNLFTSFHVKEQPNMDETKKAALKALGFSDSDITDLEGRAVQTQKAADDQGVAYKADDPEPAEITLNGQTYVLKAAPPVVEGAPEEEAAETPVEEAAEPPDEADDPAALTLSQGDIDAIASSIGAAVTQAIQPLLGLLDIEKKMQGHVQGMLAPFQQAEAKKDSELAELKETVKTQAATIAEIAGDQPAVGYRASQARDNVLTDASLLAAVKAQNPGAGPWDDVIQGLGLGLGKS